MELQVECAADYSGQPEPLFFFVGERRVGVVRIIDRWPTIGYRYLKLLADDGATYILRHVDENDGSWSLTMFCAA